MTRTFPPAAKAGLMGFAIAPLLMLTLNFITGDPVAVDAVAKAPIVVPQFVIPL